MNEMYLLSVIVPVYNAEKYLSECLDHLVKMGEKVQIILVDDESTDNSYSICESYARKHGNILLLHEKNGGPSAARNLALENAKGKYIVFCDSDDWLDERIITELEKYEKQNIDFFQFGVSGNFELLYNDVVFLDEEQKEELFSLIVGMRDNRNIGHGYFGLVTCKIFRFELVSDIRFDREVVGEDTLYAAMAYKRINTAVFLPYRFYYYRIIEGSYSRKPFPHIVPMALKMLERMKREIPDTELMKNALSYHSIDKFWWCFNATIIDRTNKKEVYDRLCELYSIPVFNSAFKNNALTYYSASDKVKNALLRSGALKILALLISNRST